ncbi:MAG: AAA family ATPase [Synechococcus sp. ELA057]
MSVRDASESPPWQQALESGLREALPRLMAEPCEPLIQELITALTAALCRGELHLDLAAAAPEEVSASLWPRGHRQALAASRLCCAPDAPLVLRGDHLLWRRWAQRQDAVLAVLQDRALQPAAPPAGIAPQALDDLLQGLDSRQKQAVQLGLERSLVLLFGGPGTGKTSTVARLLQALRRCHAQARVHLAAPTGKAAARLRAATGDLAPATTLHRLLESRGDHFGRNRQRPLALDWLVVDEVSMLDLALMEALLDALPSDCRLVLVGDPAQLPPVAPGAVLLALQQPPLAAALAPVRVELQTTYRNDGAIARVSARLRQLMEAPADAAATDGNGGIAADPLAALRPLLTALTPQDNLSWQELPSGRIPAAVLQRLARHQLRLAQLASRCWPGLEAGWADLLAERDRLLLLSPIRKGRWGVETIHQALLPGASGPQDWPSGTPVLCRRNLPELGVANGDIGILVRRSGAAASGPGQVDSRVLFGLEQPLWLHPALLAGALEPALALTVHKAQGSEAREVLLLIDGARGVDPRLLYTGLTRARERAWLFTAAPLEPAAG